MKNKFRSLLGIEMSIGNYEFKPIILLLGVLMFIVLAIPLLLIYSYIYLKSTLITSWNEIKKNNKLVKYKGVKRV